MDDDPPSSLGGSVLSAPIASAPRPVTRRRARILTGLAIAFAIGTIAFGIAGFVREASMDVPLPGNVRLGFHENGWPHRWTCPKGHDHWSVPYWSGTLLL